MGANKRKFSQNEVVALLIVLLIVVGLLMAFVEVGGRRGGHPQSCRGNLKQIGLALRMYSQEYGGQFPEKEGRRAFEMLRSGGYLENVRIYTCNSSMDDIPDNSDLSTANVSYMYVHGLNEFMPADTPLATCKYIHSACRINSVWIRGTRFGIRNLNLFPYKYGCVLHVDGRVSEIDEADLDKIRKKTKFTY